MPSPLRILSVSKGLLLCFLAILRVFESAAHAQLELTQLTPPVVQVGTKTEVAATGKFPNWPPTITCDRADVHVTPEEKSGVFQVHAEEGAYPGVAWMRLHDTDSTSTALPIFITRAPVSNETEPNDRVVEAQAVSLPAVVSGKLAKNGDSDLFRVELRKGEQLIATVVANEVLESPMDAVLQVCDSDGNVLRQAEDTRGLDPQLHYRAEKNEVVHLRVFAFPSTPNSSIRYAGGSNYQYLLCLTTGPYFDHDLRAVESQMFVEAVGFNRENGQQLSSSPPTQMSPRTSYFNAGLGWSWQRGFETELNENRVIPETQDRVESLPALFVGTIDERDETKRCLFDLEEGKTYRMEVKSRRLGYQLDARLELRDAVTSEVLASNDDMGRNDFDSRIQYKAAKTGAVELLLLDTLGTFSHRHSYQLLVAEAAPSFGLKVDQDRFHVEAGKSIDLPVTIVRESGFAGVIELKVEGLPDHVTWEPVVSESKGDSSKSVQLKLTTEASASGPFSFRIVGQAQGQDAQDGSEEERKALFPQAARFQRLPAVAYSQAWLHIKPSPSSASSP